MVLKGNGDLKEEKHQLLAVRHNQLLNVVKQRGAMNIKDLCEYLNVSEATVRRDLIFLDKKGLLFRTHGGVVSNDIVNFDQPESTRVQLNSDEKKRIGQVAINMLEGKETVLIDAGTTAQTIANFASQKPNCTYVTTSHGTAQILKDSGIRRFFLIGGSYNEINDSYIGSIAIQAIRSFSFDFAFLNVSAIDVNRRAISLGNESYAQVQKEIIASSRRKVVVADSSKFKASAFALTARFDDLDGIISVRDLDESIQRILGNESLELKLV